MHPDVDRLVPAVGAVGVGQLVSGLSDNTCVAQPTRALKLINVCLGVLLQVVGRGRQ